MSSSQWVTTSYSCGGSLYSCFSHEFILFQKAECPVDGARPHECKKWIILLSNWILSHFSSYCHWPSLWSAVSVFESDAPPTEQRSWYSHSSAFENNSLSTTLLNPTSLRKSCVNLFTGIHVFFFVLTKKITMSSVQLCFS